MSLTGLYSDGDTCEPGPAGLLCNLAFLGLLVLSVFCCEWWLAGWHGGGAYNVQLGHFTGITDPLPLF